MELTNEEHQAVVNKVITIDMELKQIEKTFKDFCDENFCYDGDTFLTEWRKYCDRSNALLKERSELCLKLF
jgi:hypothetical protein